MQDKLKEPFDTILRVMMVMSYTFAAIGIVAYIAQQREFGDILILIGCILMVLTFPFTIFKNKLKQK